MTTGIRNINPDNTAQVLDQIPYFVDGEDKYVTIGEDALGAFRAYITGEFPADEAETALETITAREDLADAATRGMDDDADLDMSELIGFTRKDGAVKRVTPVRITANADGDGVQLNMGSLVVPGVQEGKSLTFGGLTSSISEDYNVETKTTQSYGDLHFHTLSLEDSETGSIYPVSLYVERGVEPVAVKAALKAGSPLEELLTGPGGGGGGSTLNLRDVVTSEDMIPWRANIVEVRQLESSSEYALDGKSYAATLEGGQAVWMRGDAEKRLHANFVKIEADLKKGKTWTLKVTSFDNSTGKVRMRTGLEAASSGSYFAELLAAAPEAKAELPAAKAEPEAAPAPAAQAAPTPRPARKSSPFAKAKASA